MTDDDVLAMPSRRFWSMERQINRIKAGDDLRSLNVGIGLTSEDGLKQVRECLVLEIGDTAQVERSRVVKGDPDRKLKFARVMGR